MEPDADDLKTRLPTETGDWPLRSLRPHLSEFMANEAKAMDAIKDSPAVQKIKSDLTELSGLYQKPQEIMSKF